MGDRSESNASTAAVTLAEAAIPTAAVKYTHQAEKLSFVKPEDDPEGSGTAVRADYITPQDPVIITGNRGRLPGVPLAEAEKLNRFRDEINGSSAQAIDDDANIEKESDESDTQSPHNGATVQKSGEGSLRKAMPPSRTNPLFPPLPLYGPSSITRDIQCLAFRTTSFFCSLTFLGIIMLGAVFTSIPSLCSNILKRLTFRDPNATRPFIQEERRLKRLRKEEARAWKRGQWQRRSKTRMDDTEDEAAHQEFIPTEGGKDLVVCDVGYYARRVGLDMEEFKVQTEDGFIIRLWHIYNPLEYTPLSEAQRSWRGPETFTAGSSRPPRPSSSSRKPKFPILMLHGLLQSAGAYCVNDDASLAFYLCKSGYDVWLGNNRCGFKPEHTLLGYTDPRMWAWNIRQMGVLDLPALTSRVLSETGFEKLGLIAHSQGTTQTFVSLAKEQGPNLGNKLTVFCALAPAAYAGPLIGKAYFKFMRVISPAMFRIIFGIHAFIPFMMLMHRLLPAGPYGLAGYQVFHFLFDWSDTRWDRGLRDRMFQFAPVYVSAESMRWWLGRECFAKQKCILATREESSQEDVEDEMEEYYHHSKKEGEGPDSPDKRKSGFKRTDEVKKKHDRQPTGATSWYDNQVPPFALWVCGNDDLVDGRRLLRRFERGREPNVRLVHSKVVEEYEHLDVIWAMDSIEKVGKEVKEVLWKTCDVRDQVRVPKGCEDIEAWRDPKLDKYNNGDEVGYERDSNEDGQEELGDQSSSSEN